MINGFYNPAILSRNLRGLRLAAGMSQADIAKALGVSQNSVWKYESGQAEPSLAVLSWYSNEFDVSIDALLFKLGGKKHE